MGTVVDLVSRLPVQIWFKENPNTSDTQFEADLLGVLSAKTLLILDRGFYHFQFWMQLIEQQVAFICRLKAGASYTVERVFTPSPSSERLSNQAGSQTQKCSERCSCVWYRFALVLPGTVTSPLCSTLLNCRHLWLPISTVAGGALKKHSSR
jgi:hypothetical protein